MNQRQIDRYFRILSEQLDEKAIIILTGAAAASLLGEARPSIDIDFAIQLAKRDPRLWRKVEEAVNRTRDQTGISANYAEDIDRWGQITLLDYKKHTLPYRQFNQLRVRLLDPAYWSIGKMTRYLEPDVRDMVRVFKRRKVSASKLVRIWGKALRKSPRSLILSQFRRQVENFLRSQGRYIWGRQFDAEHAIRQFHKAAGIHQINHLRS